MAMKRRISITCAAVLVGAVGVSTAQAQFSTLVTDFEGSFSNPLNIAEVVFRDPTVSGTTRGVDPAILADTFLSDTASLPGFVLPSSGTQALLVAYGWENESDPTSWVRLITSNTDDIPNPSLHLGGTVRIWIAATAFTNDTFATPVTNGNLLIGLGVRETGLGVPLGASGGTAGDVEWVGISDARLRLYAGTNGICDTMVDPGTDDVQINPMGANVGINGECIGAGTNGVINTTAADDDESATIPDGLLNLPSDGVVREYVFDLPALEASSNAFGFTGDGVLGATPNNRGTLDHLVITNDAAANGPNNAKVWVLSIDDITFESPVLDPPAIVTDPAPPLPLGESVDVELIKNNASKVAVYRLEIDGSETLLGSNGMVTSTTETVSTSPLPGNALVVARQQVGGDISDNSEPVVVSSPGNGPIRMAMAVRETDQFDNALGCGADGTGFDPDQPSTLEFVGAETTSGFGIPDGRRIKPEIGWQEVRFNPCTDGVAVFSGDGVLNVNSTGLTKAVFEGLYYRIDDQSPTTGPYTIYIDDLKVENAEGLGLDCVIDDFESYTPGDFIIEADVDANGDGTADSVAEGDDVQIVSVGATTFNGQIIIGAGTNGVIDTTPATGEGISQIRARFNLPGTAGTSVGLAASPDACAVTDEESFSGSQSLKVEWAFLSAANPSSVVRHTTNGSLATEPPETLIGPDPVFELTNAPCDDGIDLVFSFMLLFEPPAIPADCDADGDVDLADYGCFQLCLGEAAPFTAPCEVLDIAPNGAPDGVIDLADFALFNILLIGPQ
jgi:hypothetical protein